MPYYKGNILSSARSFLQKDEFLFSVAKVSQVKTGEWMRTDSSNPEQKLPGYHVILAFLLYYLYIGIPCT